MNLKGIIFDLDGTLIDSPLSLPAIKRELGVNQGNTILEHISAIENKDKRQQAIEIVLSHEKNAAQSAFPIAGVEELLQKLNEKEIKTAIVTLNSKAATAQIITCLNHDFDFVITRDDFPPKPDPASANYIAKEWQLKPQEICFIGDYKNDILTGKNAGMKTAFYSREKNSVDNMNSDFIFNNYKTLEEMLFTSK